MRKFVFISISAVFAAVMAAIIAFSLLYSAQTFTAPKGMLVKDKNIMLVPEAERPLDFVVVGLWPDGKQYYYLPELSFPAGTSEEQKTK